ncbi:MAG TPA: tetratricopeptide repeat protein [Burkholderiaceae bacterium]|nr:tetratricopeptide repeat protein [Burkholderiaceae bacterium]
MIDAKFAAARGTSERRLGRALAGDLDTIVMKSLAKSPGERYATVAEFAEDLQRYRDGLPVRAQPASFGYRARKFFGRNKVTVGAAAGVLVALMVGATLAAWQAREAHRAAAKADAVKDFLTALFEANSLERTDAERRRSLTAAQLLEEGAARIGTHFHEQPELKLELQSVIGRLMHDLALNEQALALRQERVTVLARADAPATERAQALRDLADTLAQKGDYGGATAQLQAAIDLLAAKGSRGDDVLRWSLVSALGNLSMDSDRKGGEQKLQQAADALRRIAPQSIEYGDALISLGEAHSAANRTDLSVPMFDEALQLLERALGPRSMRLARYRHHVAEALASQRRWHESEVQMRAAIEILRETAGPNHPSTAVAELFLGRLLSVQGHPAQARALLEPAAAVLKGRQDFDPQYLANALLYLGEAYLDEGRIAEAGPALEDAVRRLEVDGSATPLSTARTIYARYLLDTGRYADAEAQLVAARAQRTALTGPEHPSVATLTNRLGLVYAAAGRTTEAEATFRSVLVSQANREDVFGSPRHLAAINLAAMDLERERYPEALAAFSGFLQAFDALPASDRSRVAEVTLCLRLARALLGVGRTDEADALLRRSGQLTPAFYEHAPLRLQQHLVKARLLGARGEVNNARAEVALARASLRAQPALGPHFERQVQLTERDITRGR